MGKALDIVYEEVRIETLLIGQGLSLRLIKESHFKCWVRFRTLHEQHIMVTVVLFLHPIFQLLLQQHWSPAVSF
jgi:hypothetical protein